MTATILSRFLGFIALYFFHNLIEILGQAKCYWLFTSSCLLGTIFVYYYIPETKGKTLEQIQDLLNSNKTAEVSKDLENV